jgi:signal peptidase II
MSDTTTSVNEDSGHPGLPVLFTLAGIVAVTDRVTKVLCNANLVEGMPVTVFPGFDLLLGYNAGAAFSFLNDAGGWQRWFLTAISASISVALSVWLVKLPRFQRLLGFALALILGGALGNLYDRALTGYVIDFISVYYEDYRFATFNIAYAAISVGAALMVLDMVMDDRSGKSGGNA